MTKGIIMAKRIKGSGDYLLYGDSYPYRQKIAQMGGVFSKIAKGWIVSRAVVDDIHAAVQVMARVAAHCHKPEEIIQLNEGIARAGVVWLGCSRCDRREGEMVAVLEVLGEAETVVQ